MSDYKIHLDVFEGPLALLMHLIEKNKIDIYDIPITEITRQYMDYLNRYRSYNMELASEFLVMAATLLYIKSRILLPVTNEDGEDEAEADPRRQLVDRLLEYKKFRAVSEYMQELFDVQSQLFFRTAVRPLEYRPLPNMEVELLWRSFCAMFDDTADIMTVVAQDKFTVGDKIAAVMAALRTPGAAVELASLAASGAKGELIAAFLAVLELIRRKKVCIEQRQPFCPIIITLRPEAAIDVI